MIKTCFMSDYDNLRLQDAVNKFIRTEKVIDIKFNSLTVPTQEGLKIVDRVLIIYEEVENNDLYNFSNINFVCNSCFINTKIYSFFTKTKNGSNY